MIIARYDAILDQSECQNFHQTMEILFKTREHCFKESQEKQFPLPHNVFEVEKLFIQISEKHFDIRRGRSWAKREY